MEIAPAEDGFTVAAQGHAIVNKDRARRAARKDHVTPDMERLGWIMTGPGWDTLLDLGCTVGETTKMTSRPRIIGVVTAGNIRDPLAWEALATCDLAEFRADTWVGAGTEASEIPALLREFREEGSLRFGHAPETLFTLRLERDGGSWPDDRAGERLEIWSALAGAEGPRACEWIDIEVEEVPNVGAPIRDALQALGVKVLVSHHNFETSYSQEELKQLLGIMRETSLAGVKFALTCNTRAELIDLLALARDVADQISWGSVFSMGKTGRATRVLSPLLGCPFTYGYLTGGAVAPGQLSAAELWAFFASAPFPPANDLETLLRWAENRLQEDGLAR